MITVIKRNNDTYNMKDESNEIQDLFEKKFVCGEFRINDEKIVDNIVNECDDNNQEKIEFKNECSVSDNNHIKLKNGYRPKFDSKYKSFHKRINYHARKNYEGTITWNKHENHKKGFRNIYTFNESL
jgi:hypothetical protein